MLDWLARGMAVGDVVISPVPNGRIRVGRVAGGYRYEPSAKPRHRRPVTWLGVVTPSRPLTSWQALFTIGTGSSLYGPLSNDLATVPEQSAAEEPRMSLE